MRIFQNHSRMVTLVSNNSKHNFTKGISYNEKDGIPKVKLFLNRKREENAIVCKDYEASGLCPITDKPLLLILGDREQQFVIDVHNLNMDWLKDYDDLTYLGHNIKFDISYSMHHFKCKPFNVLCTMVIDQKLYQNNKYSALSNPEGNKYQLDYLMSRHLGYVPPETDKTIRNYFIGLKPSEARYNDKHILYAAGDVKYLEDIYNKQMVLAKKYELYWWLHNYELPLISVLAECENLGFAFDSEKWKENIVKSKKLQQQYAIELDNEFRRLRDTLVDKKNIYLKGGKWDRKRSKKIVALKLEGLFGEMKQKDFFKVKGYNSSKSKSNINWASPDTILLMLEQLKLPAPTQGSTFKEHGYLIPCSGIDNKLNKSIGVNKDGNWVTLHDATDKGCGWTVGKKAWQLYLVDFPSTPLKKFLSLLNKYSSVTTEITNYGQNYIEKINPITGRIHTIYRQTNTVNGRLQSGGGRKLATRYNSQNLPRDLKFRSCFIGGKNGNESYSIFTGDLTGAEVTFMCDKAEDEVLYEWAVVNDDSHSPMVQNVWRNIFLYRAGKSSKVWKTFDQFKAKCEKKSILKEIGLSTNKNAIKWFNLSKTFIVNKKVNKPYRTAGKNGTFGGVYGMKEGKAQETYNNTDTELAKVSDKYEPVNVSLIEGKVALYAQRKAIPKTYEMVERNVVDGLTKGYLVLNSRSKSRLWLPDVMRMKTDIIKEMKSKGYKKFNLKYKNNGWVVIETGNVYGINFKKINDYEGQLRNVPISGTQADCVKEAMVEIATYIRKNSLDEIGVAFLSQVHDELVYRLPKSIDGTSDKWFDKTKRKSCKFTFDKPITEKKFNDKHKDEHIITSYKNKNEEIYATECSFPKFVQLTMIETANRYLKHYEMKSSMEILDSWTK